MFNYIKPDDGLPINRTNGGSAGFVKLINSPGPNLSWYVLGFLLTGGASADGFSIIRRSSVKFSAANNTVTVSDNAALEPGTGDAAIEFGIKAESTAVSVSKILHKDDGSDQGYIIETTSAGNLKVTVGDGTNTANVTTINPINDGNWHHIIVNIDTSSATGLKIYVDGMLAVSAGADLSSVGSITGGATNLTIVGETAKTFYISTLGIYKGQILSATEIEARYGAAPGQNGAGSKFIGTEVGISAAWNFDEGTGTTLNDLVGSNDGTIANATWQDGEGLPIDPHTLGKTIQYNTGILNTNGVVGNTPVIFPHAIKIGRNNPIRIEETDGSWALQLFAVKDKY